jgi:hypothetical protein
VVEIGAVLVLSAEEDPNLGIPGLGLETLLQSFDRVPAFGGVLQLGDKRLGRGGVAGQPISYRSVRVQDEDERRRTDAVFADERFSRDLTPDGAEEDESALQKRVEAGIIVDLPAQQVTVPSAVLGEEVDQQQLVLRLGLSQGGGDGVRPPGEAKDGGSRGHQDDDGKKIFLHVNLPKKHIIARLRRAVNRLTSPAAVSKMDPP